MGQPFDLHGTLDSVIFAIRDRFKPADSATSKILRLEERLEPEIFAGYHEFEDWDIEQFEQVKSGKNASARAQLVTFLLGKAKAQIAYNLLRLLKEGFWKEENRIYNQIDYTSYEEIDKLTQYSLFFDYSLLIPALEELVMLQKDLKDVHFKYKNKEENVIFDNSYSLNSTLATTLRKEKKGKKDGTTLFDIDVKFTHLKEDEDITRTKIKRFYQILNLFDTFKEIPTDPDHFHNTIDATLRINRGEYLKKDFELLATKDSRYSGIDSRMEFVYKASETKGQKAMVFIDIGGMNVANRSSMGKTAGKFVRSILQTEYTPSDSIMVHKSKLNLAILNTLVDVDRALNDTYQRIISFITEELNGTGNKGKYTINSIHAGGDELKFDISISSEGNRRTVENAVKSALRRLEERDPIKINGINMSGRAGIAFYNNSMGISDVKAALEASDEQLEKAKDKQKGLFPSWTDMSNVSSCKVQIPKSRKRKYSSPHLINLVDLPTRSDTEKEYYAARVYHETIGRYDDKSSLEHQGITPTELELLKSIAFLKTTIPNLSLPISAGNQIFVMNQNGSQRKYWNDTTKRYTDVNTVLSLLENSMISEFKEKSDREDIIFNVLQRRNPNITGYIYRPNTIKLNKVYIGLM